MIVKSILKIAVLSYLIFTQLSCSSTNQQLKASMGLSGSYDTEFPNKNASNELEDISNSIFRVSSIAFYRTYVFSDTSKIKKSELSAEIIENNTIKSTVIDKPALGTGTLIYSSLGNVGILTCAHVISFPDTIITYYAESTGIFSDYIQSISIKTKQNIYIAGFPEGSEVDVILKDDNLDIALLGRQFDIKAAAKYQVFNYPFGNSKELRWGTFVYLMGYPLNYKIISRALVSSPNYDKNGSFLIDAPINRGFSGGIILAVKQGIPNFELVGLIQSVPEEDENVLEPISIDKRYKYSNSVPYTGLHFIKELKLFDYGIAKVVSIDAVINFFKRNREFLISKGYDLSIFN